MGDRGVVAARGKYQTVLADPPWDYRNGGNGRARAHYPLMTIEQIIAMPVQGILADDAVLLLWTTWPQLAGALQVVSAWGFEYVTGFPWIKTYDPPWADLFGEPHIRPTFGTGSWLRGCSEPILIAKRGAIKPPELSWLGLISERMEHSRKPASIYEYAESFPAPRVELFARRRREGWDAWGNEVESDVDLSTLSFTTHEDREQETTGGCAPVLFQ